VAGAVLAALGPHSLPGQTGECRLAGRVTGLDGAPIPGATLQATGSAFDVTARAILASDGRYCLALPRGGEYVLQVDAEGFVGRSLLLTVSGEGPAQTLDLELTPVTRATVQLDPVVARAAPRAPQPTRRGAAPGSETTSRAAASIGLFPGAPGDLAASAGVSGHYVPVAGGDISINGQPPTGNRTTLDGAGFDAREVPAEGLAAAGVFPHPYDVSRGQFTGGEIAGRTMGGTNVWGGAMRFAAETQWRASDGGPDAGGSAWPRQLFFSGGGGGPLLPGRLFMYGAAQADQRRVEPFGPDPAGPGFAIAADSLARFRHIVEGLGFGSSLGAATGHTRSASAIARLDYIPDGRHEAMLRLDARGRESSRAAGTAPGLLAEAREQSFGSGALVQLTSRLNRAENEFSLRGSMSGQRVPSAGVGPAGEVWIGSGGSSDPWSGGQLAFGGEPLGLPAEERTAFEVGDRLVLTLSDGKHQLQVGGAWQAEQVWRASQANRLGTFTFASLGDLEAGRPVRFTRALGDRVSEVTAGYMAAYAAHVWKPGPDLRVLTGVRGERYSFASPTRSWTGADSTFGMRPVPADSRWRMSPRAGFTWYNSGPTSTFSVLGGTGLFRGAAPTRLLAALLGGESGRTANLVCVGSAVPAPRWEEYVDNPAAIPTECAGGAAGLPSPAMVGVTGFSAGYSPPSVWHSSLGATWLHRPSGFGAELRLGYARGRSVALASDLNLDREPVFFLDTEGGRPVFAAPVSIDPASGQLSPESSRLDPRFGVVREVNGRGASSSRTLGLVLHRLTGSGLTELHYTLTWSRDQSTGFAGPAGGWATTAADPRMAEWAASDFEQRHAVQLSMVRYLRRWATGTVVWRLLSGTPFTPVVDGDINGDGQANDRAFVFEAGAGDPRLSADMAALLDRVPAATRSCLQRQAGRIAARNSCRTPWNSFLDLQLNLFPGGPRNKRVVLNVSAENVSSGLDHLLHGPRGLRGWGQYPSADPVLLRSVGFDAETREFRYQVNPGFGPDAGRWGGVPFSLRIQARVMVGADPATQALVAQAVLNQDRADPASLRTDMLGSWRNVPAGVLQHDLTHAVGLAPGQLAALRAAADTVRAESERIAGALADGVLELGGSDAARVRSAAARQRELLRDAQGVLDRGLTTTQSILTPEQWLRLPRRLRAEVRATLPMSAHSGVKLLPDF
jgi:hypothetical protein